MDSLSVFIGNRPAGHLYRHSGGELRFEYTSSYREGPQSTPLSVSMPLQIGAHRDPVVKPWLWGLLPDNEAVVQRWAREFQVSAGSPFALLSSPIGRDCAGAVQFIPTDETPDIGGDVHWLTESEVATRLHELLRDSTTWHGRDFTGQFSLAGAQAKTALLLEDGKWGVPSGAIPTTHILKPAISGLDDHDLNEHLCLDAARRLGLDAVETLPRRFGDVTAIVITRYDRMTASDGRILRRHQEDVCQARGVSPAAKYQREGGPGAREVVDLLKRTATESDHAVARFFDALIWNWLVGGTDAHAKNYSLLLEGYQVELAPLYDIASALPYGDHERKLRLAMKLGGDYSLVPYVNPWPKVANELGIDAELALERVRELATLTPNAFAEAASTPEVSALKSELPSRLSRLIEHRCASCLKLLH